LIFIDANIFMYAAGAAHPHKAASVDFLRQIARGEFDAATDAEVLQEILHRYRAICRWDDGNRVYESARRVVPNVFPITADVVNQARSLMTTDSGLGARDAVHAAAALLNGCAAICSFDRDFDRIDGLARIAPQ
jgi:uncharacterized protein